LNSIKFSNLRGLFPAAKAVIDHGQVMVNGKVETRRRKKILSGDIIEYMNEKLKISLK
jgi:ribosome-associated protein